MQRPGHKINTREANPNAFITFIRALEGKPDSAVAEHTLKAIAAQVQKIMEKRFMYINTLEEAKYNGVFAGRNWNHGQTVESVLRRPDGRFYPLNYVMSVMCHEMAHITHMNHGKEFQKLMAAIKEDVRQMQSRGYYGDGFWSDGKRLKDGAVLGAEGLKQSDFPDYVCGVSKADARKARRPRRGTTSSSAPGLVRGEASHRSGRQTEYKRKAGRKNNADMGEATGRLDGRRQITREDRKQRTDEIGERAAALVRGGLGVKAAKKKATDEWDGRNPWFKAGSSHGKKAASKTAAELRAEAAERRLIGAKLETMESDEDELENNGVGDWSEEDESKPIIIDSDDDDGIEFIEVADPHLSAGDRRRELEDEMSDDEREELTGGWEEFLPIGAKRKIGAVDSSHGPSGSSGIKTEPGTSRAGPSAPPRPKASIGTTSFSASDLLRQERLRGQGLASTTSQKTNRALGGDKENRSPGRGRPSGSSTSPPGNNRGSGESSRRVWACLRCTFVNSGSSILCEVCEASEDGTGGVAL